jgi:hypothetical protein
MNVSGQYFNQSLPPPTSSGSSSYLSPLYSNFPPPIIPNASTPFIEISDPDDRKGKNKRIKAPNTTWTIDEDQKLVSFEKEIGLLEIKKMKPKNTVYFLLLISRLMRDID